MLLEVFWLSVRFDTTPLVAYDNWWTNVIGLAPAALGVLFAAGAATIFALTTDIGGTSRLPSAFLVESSKPLGWLAGHLLFFGIFFSLTRTVIERDLTQSSINPGLWLCAWLISGLGMMFCLAGVALPLRSWFHLFRRGWLVLAVALLIGSLAWAAGEVTGSYWDPLHAPTFSAVETVLGHLGQDVSVDSRDLSIAVTGASGDFTVIIDQSCSGYQGVGLIWVFLLVFLWLDRRSLRFPNALLLLPLGTALIWVLNVFRLAALMVIGAWVSESVALGGFHSQVGWLSFLAVSLGMATAVNHSKFLSKRPLERGVGGLAHPEASHLLPFLTWMALGMITMAFSSGGFDWLYPIRVLGTGAVLLAYWRSSIRGFCKESLFDPLNLVLGCSAAAIWIAIGIVIQSPDQGLDPGEVLAGAPLVLSLTWVCSRVVGAVLIVPAAEELAFRSYMTRRLISQDFEKVRPGSFSWFSFLGSSVAFGILHQHWAAAMVAGMLFALAYYRRGQGRGRNRRTRCGECRYRNLRQYNRSVGSLVTEFQRSSSPPQCSILLELSVVDAEDEGLERTSHLQPAT